MKDTVKILFESSNGPYIYRTELVNTYCPEMPLLNMTRCYSSYTGEYLGGVSEAMLICHKYGISKLQSIEYAKDGTKGPFCSIGFQKDKQLWYGYSGRAIYGFGIGSQCIKGDCSYVPATVDELYDSVCLPDEDGFAWQKPENVEKLENGIRIRHRMVDLGEPDENGRYLPERSTEVEPEYQIIEVGRGEWTATTLEEAKQMAIDFANGVS